MMTAAEAERETAAIAATKKLFNVFKVPPPFFRLALQGNKKRLFEERSSRNLV
jgi:hypothetical protein